MENTYTCSICHRTFEQDWSDEQADAELLTIFGTTRAKTQCYVVCDVCWQKIPKPN